MQPNAILDSVESMQVHFGYEVPAKSCVTPPGLYVNNLAAHENVLEIPGARCSARLDILQAPAAWSVPIVARRMLALDAPPFTVQATIFGDSIPSISFACYFLTEEDLKALSSGTWDPSKTKPSNNIPSETQEGATSEGDSSFKMRYTVGARYSKLIVADPSKLRPQWVMFSATMHFWDLGNEETPWTARLFTLLKVPTIFISRPADQEVKALSLLWAGVSSPPCRAIKNLSLHEIRLFIRRQLCAGIKNARVRQSLIKEDFSLLIQKCGFFNLKQEEEKSMSDNASRQQCLDSWITGLQRILHVVGDAYVDGYIASLDCSTSKASRIAADLPCPEVCILCFNYDLNPGDLVAIMGGHPSKALSCVNKIHIPASLLIKEGLGACLARCAHLQYVYNIFHRACIEKSWLYTDQYLTLDSTFCDDPSRSGRSHMRVSTALHEIQEQQQQLLVIQQEFADRLLAMENRMLCGGGALALTGFPPTVGYPVVYPMGLSTANMCTITSNISNTSQVTPSTFKHVFGEGLGDNLEMVRLGGSSVEETFLLDSELVLPSISTLMNEDHQVNGQ